MWPLRRKPTPTLERTTERELIGLARGGSGAAFGEIMRRNNRRLFRAARGIIGTDWEAEEVVQDAYVQSVPCPRSFPRRGRTRHLADAHRDQRGTRSVARPARNAAID